MNRGMKKMNRGGEKMMMGGESMTPRTPMKHGGKASKKRGMARGCGAATKGKGYNK
jgi:hypothetical protein|tara:strand:+ start:828 stop:995 length:168 start_codon:yes stop_codon:yes gene_type:complete